MINLSANIWRALNIFARVLGLSFSVAGLYFAARGIYFIVLPEMAGTIDTLGFAPWFRPFVIAFVLLAVGVHFVKGTAHRPDLLQNIEAGKSPSVIAQNWWTGEPLENRSRREHDI